MGKRRKSLTDALRKIPNIDRRWLIIWAIIYTCFLILDIFRPNYMGATLIKYVGIFLCVVYAHQKFRRDHLLILALLFTLLSDTVLMWIPSAEIIGVFSFCFAQFFHTARFAQTTPKFLIIYFASIFTLFVFGVILGFPPIYCIAAVYAISLLMNVRLAYRWHKTSPGDPHALYAAAGFFLFVACDICVGLSYLAENAALPLAITPVISYFVWVFYYPSQVLISNSSNIKQNGAIITSNGR